MGKATQAALDAYRKVLIELGSVTGYIQWKPVPLDWLHRNLSNVTVRLIHEAMISHAIAGGTIDQVVEKRPLWIQWQFHYDIRLPILDRRIYIETVFEHEPCLEDCTIWVVSLHDQ